jgi:hypothetical protein
VKSALVSFIIWFLQAKEKPLLCAEENNGARELAHLGCTHLAPPVFALGNDSPGRLTAGQHIGTVVVLLAR